MHSYGHSKLVSTARTGQQACRDQIHTFSTNFEAMTWMSVLYDD